VLFFKRINSLKFLFSIFIFASTLTILNRSYCEPVSLSVYTKQTPNGLKKIALLGVKHGNTEKENAFFECFVDAIEHAGDNTEPVDVLLEVYKNTQVQRTKITETGMVPESFERQLTILENQVPLFNFVKADERWRVNSLFDFLHKFYSHFLNIKKIVTTGRRVSAYDHVFLSNTAKTIAESAQKIESSEFYVEQLSQLTNELKRLLIISGPESTETTIPLINTLLQKWVELVNLINPELVQESSQISILINPQRTMATGTKWLQQSPEIFEALQKFICMDIADAYFLNHILNSQLTKNKTILVCGNDHIFGIIQTALNALGYQQQSDAKGILTPSELVHEETTNPITPNDLRLFLTQFLS